MFVYGPPGNGKTVISQAIRKLLDGDIAIPHAIEVEGAHHPLVRSGQPRAARRAATTTTGLDCASTSATAAGSAAAGRW